MAKRSGENQDYYKRAGQASGRRILAKERRKLSEARASQRGGDSLPRSEPAAKATGAGVQTAELTRRRRERQQAERETARQALRVEHDEVQRMVEAEAPTAPPERLLPPAQPATELSDLVRSVLENGASAWGAGRTLYRSLAELVRAPLRLLRLVRGAARA